jgi:hypothetical protein
VRRLLGFAIAVLKYARLRYEVEQVSYELTREAQQIERVRRAYPEGWSEKPTSRDSL